MRQNKDPLVIYCVKAQQNDHNKSVIKPHYYKLKPKKVF